MTENNKKTKISSNLKEQAFCGLILLAICGSLFVAANLMYTERGYLADSIYHSAAVASRSKRQIGWIQSEVNNIIEKNGGTSKDFIEVDGLYGRQTDSAIRSSQFITKEDLYNILNSDMVLDEFSYNRKLKKERQNAEKGMDDEWPHDQLQPPQQNNIMEPPTLEELREAEANNVRNVLHLRWLKGKKQHNAEVEDFQKETNRLVGQKVLREDGIMGWRTEEMLLRELTIEQIENLEESSPVVSRIMTRHHIETCYASQAEANAQEIQDVLHERWKDTAEKYNPEVELFQKAVNKLLGRKVLKTDGFFGKKTQDVLKNQLDFIQLNLLEFDNKFIQDIMQNKKEHVQKQKQPEVNQQEEEEVKPKQKESIPSPKKQEHKAPEYQIPNIRDLYKAPQPTMMASHKQRLYKNKNQLQRS